MIENEQYEFQKMLLEAETMIKKQKDAISEIDQYHKLLEGNIEYIKTHKPQNYEADNYEKNNIQKEILECERAIRTRIGQLYDSMFELKVSRKNYDILNPRQAPYAMYDEVEVAEINDGLLVKLPMMLPKTTEKSKSSKKINGNTFLKYYDNFFANELFSKIVFGKIDNKSNFWKIENKLLHFVFLYGDDARKISDSDSHDTKKAIDAITSDMKFGDSGLTTSILYETVYDPKCHDCTLVFVSEMKQNIIQKNDIVTLGIEHFNIRK